MLELTQKNNGLIGSNESINILANKNSARILVISDSHGYPNILFQILKRYSSGCDALFFLGDGIADIASILEKAHTDKDFKQILPPVLALVQGNNDSGTYPLSYKLQENLSTEFFSFFAPTKQIVSVCNKNLLLTHGHSQSVYYGNKSLLEEAEFYDAKAVFFGHTHIPYEEKNKNVYLINPGSCSIPRGGNPPSFAISTIEKGFIDTAFIQFSKMNKCESQQNELNFSLFTPNLY